LNISEESSPSENKNLFLEEENSPFHTLPSHLKQEFCHLYNLSLTEEDPSPSNKQPKSPKHTETFYSLHQRPTYHELRQQNSEIGNLFKEKKVVKKVEKEEEKRKKERGKDLKRNYEEEGKITCITLFKTFEKAQTRQSKTDSREEKSSEKKG
jgi:hypothetical protein